MLNSKADKIYKQSEFIMQNTFLESQLNGDTMSIRLKDLWVFENVSNLISALNNIDLSNSSKVIFECAGIDEIDIAGAWVLISKSHDYQDRDINIDFQGFKAAHYKFLEHINRVSNTENISEESRAPSFSNRLKRFFVSLGLRATSGLQDIGQIVHFIADGARNPSKLLFKETIRQISETGIKAIPVVSLVAFLMGVVMAYQGATQLQKFGASIFVVDMVAISMLRELGVILAGIMVAGRSGSAFAAAIGVMNINEETDALRVMGLNPNQILILPRLLGLLISLPLLTLIADIAGIAGGMLLSVTVLDISAVQFMHRMREGVELNTFLVGIYKAPVFAILIASVATLRGMQVKSSAEELGRLTTVAVVQSITLIIIADGLFAVIFSKMGI